MKINAFILIEMPLLKLKFNKKYVFSFMKAKNTAVETDIKAGRIDVINQLNKLHNYILLSMVNLHLIGNKNKVPCDEIRGEEWVNINCGFKNT
uniref:Uncharacterized protein n=1 Tax=Meloidogyne enterolobii TaxID=390850 RepID=A0A6V7UMJ1_MELEN|nr:unnamed protein product [Meloidogyne enterolobii]